MPRNTRAQLVDALRELATFIERDDDRPVPYHIDAVLHLQAGEQQVLDAAVASIGGGEVIYGSAPDDGKAPIDRYVIRLDGNVTYGVQWRRDELRAPTEATA